MKKLLIVFAIIPLMVLTSCYRGKSKEHDAMTEGDSLLFSPEQRRALQDSISFFSHHHYTNNYNFIVTSDSLPLIIQRPEELVADEDTHYLYIHHHEDLVVADILVLPSDTVDSVWVKLAHDQETIGWIHEKDLLPNVSPNDPISQFISTFSDFHLLVTLIFVAVIFAVYVVYLFYRKKARFIHINDIPSFYPTALVLIVAMAATFYSTIQLFYPEIWKHYYYHPTLNPLSVPAILSIFLFMVWLLPIAAIAAVDDAFRHLHFGEAVMYMLGLSAVCLMVYILFSVSTLYYIGYPLLVAYVVYSVTSFYRNRRLTYFCGNCGKAIARKGKCPYCGSNNI